MTRKETETKILDKMQEIVEIYREYNPDGEYLTLAFRRDDEADADWIHVSNDYYNHPGYPLYMSRKGDEIYDAIRD